MCTGMKNVLLTDEDGGVLGSVGQFLPNNAEIMDSSICTKIEEWNGY